ncbi:putative integral membrane protein [Brugia pahangi]
MAIGQTTSYYCMIDGTLLLLIMNQLTLAWILYELLNPTSICWNEIIQYANETYIAFDNQIMQQFGLINQRLQNQMHQMIEICIEIRLETLLGKSLDINNIKTLKFPFRNQMITGLFKGILALLTNSWHIWLIWHARLPTTITPNNVALPVLNIGALSSLFWIIISIIYQWSNLWYEKSLLEQAPTLPFAEIRLLLLISTAILINWFLLYTLYRAFIENKNGIARILSKSDEKSK